MHKHTARFVLWQSGLYQWDGASAGDWLRARLSVRISQQSWRHSEGLTQACMQKRGFALTYSLTFTLFRFSYIQSAWCHFSSFCLSSSTHCSRYLPALKLFIAMFNLDLTPSLLSCFLHLPDAFSPPSFWHQTLYGYLNTVKSKQCFLSSHFIKMLAQIEILWLSTHLWGVICGYTVHSLYFTW